MLTHLYSEEYRAITPIGVDINHNEFYIFQEELYDRNYFTDSGVQHIRKIKRKTFLLQKRQH